MKAFTVTPNNKKFMVQSEKKLYIRVSGHSIERLRRFAKKESPSKYGRFTIKL